MVNQLRTVLKGALLWPHMVIVARGALVRNGPLAGAVGPFILLHPDVKQYRAVLIHEQQHVRQWWYTTLLSLPVIATLEFSLVADPSWLRVVVLAALMFHLLSKCRAFRRWAEINACRRELAFFGYSNAIAVRLANRLRYAYDLDDNWDLLYTDLVKTIRLQSHSYLK